jgi:hypothetical protein
MVMVEKLKRTLAEELHEAPQKQIYKGRTIWFLRGGGGGWKIQTVQEFFFRPGEQDRYFFPVKVQRKIFFPNIFGGRIFFFASNNNGLQ